VRSGYYAKHVAEGAAQDDRAGVVAIDELIRLTLRRTESSWADPCVFATQRSVLRELRIPGTVNPAARPRA
jgi:hypothetical protein